MNRLLRHAAVAVIVFHSLTGAQTGPIESDSLTLPPVIPETVTDSSVPAPDTAAIAADSTVVTSTAIDSNATGIVIDSGFFEYDFVHDGTEADAADLLTGLPGISIQRYGPSGQGVRVLINGVYARQADILLDGLPALVAMPDLPDISLLPYFNLRRVSLDNGTIVFTTEDEAKLVPFMRVTYQASNFLPLIPIDNRWQQGGAYIGWQYLPAGTVQGYYRSALSEAVNRDGANYDNATTTHLGAAVDYLFAGRLLVRGTVTDVYNSHTAGWLDTRVRALRFNETVTAGVFIDDRYTGMRLNQRLLYYTNRPYWPYDTPFGLQTGYAYLGRGSWQHHIVPMAQTLGIDALWHFESMADAVQDIRASTARVKCSYGFTPSVLLRINGTAGAFFDADGTVFEPELLLSSVGSPGFGYRIGYRGCAIKPALAETFGVERVYYPQSNQDTLIASRNYKQVISAAGTYAKGHMNARIGIHATFADGLWEPAYDGMMGVYSNAVITGINAGCTYTYNDWQFKTLYHYLQTAAGTGVLYHRPEHAGQVVVQRNKVYKNGKLHWGTQISANGQSKASSFDNLTGAGKTTAPFARLDAKTSLRIMDIRLTYTMENVFDTDYRYFYGYPMPGRTHRMTVDWDFWN